jgi:hypothetical protein
MGGTLFCFCLFERCLFREHILKSSFVWNGVQASDTWSYQWPCFLWFYLHLVWFFFGQVGGTYWEKALFPGIWASDGI